MFYLVKTPWWLKKLYPRYTWHVKSSPGSLFLTFDDGPHPTITPFVLDQLKLFGAKASFFCIGKNVQQYPEVYQRILAEGHSVGNHTQQHLNGWKTPADEYIADIARAKAFISSDLFRPPYGRISRQQFRLLEKKYPGSKLIMWDVLSGDFDPSISKERCLENVQKHTKSGAVIVFHDSEKAYEKMSYALPLLLQQFTEKGNSFLPL